MFVDKNTTKEEIELEEKLEHLISEIVYGSTTIAFFKGVGNSYATEMTNAGRLRVANASLELKAMLKISEPHKSLEGK